MITDSQGRTIRCPSKDNGGGIVGCGSENVTERDEEGFYDCLDCGIWFDPEYHNCSQQRRGKRDMTCKGCGRQFEPTASWERHTSLCHDCHNIKEGEDGNAKDSSVLRRTWAKLYSVCEDGPVVTAPWDQGTG